MLNMYSMVKLSLIHFKEFNNLNKELVEYAESKDVNDYPDFGNKLDKVETLPIETLCEGKKIY